MSRLFLCSLSEPLKPERGTSVGSEYCFTLMISARRLQGGVAEGSKAECERSEAVLDQMAHARAIVLQAAPAGTETLPGRAAGEAAPLSSD